MKFGKAITRICRELQGPLPGRKHQYMMAPGIRINPGNISENKKAAVLICLFKGKNDLQIVFIKRTEYDGPHSGQISFPGGMYKDTDHDLLETALRETEEETGISRDHARILGALSPLEIPVSNITVYPFVSIYDQEPAFRIDEREVSYLIMSNLRAFIDSDIRKNERWTLYGNEIDVPFFQLDENKIWGATAMILSEFIAVVLKSDIYSRSYP